MNLIVKVFKDYFNFRKQLNVHNFFYYFWKLFIPLFFSSIIYYVFFKYIPEINHKDISTTLVSTNSVITAFLVLSLTVLLTQNNIRNLPNSNIDYKKFLVTNVEVGVILIFFSIIVSLIYMLLSSSKVTPDVIESYTLILGIISYLSIFLTILVVKLTIDDLLLLSNKLK